MNILKDSTGQNAVKFIFLKKFGGWHIMTVNTWLSEIVLEVTDNPKPHKFKYINSSLSQSRRASLQISQTLDKAHLASGKISFSSEAKELSNYEIGSWRTALLGAGAKEPNFGEGC